MISTGSRAQPEGTAVIRIKRTYDPAAREDGQRYLVERLWPRGMKKESLTLDVWLKDVAPSAGLRSWFGHRPERWSEFLAVRGCGGSTTRRPGDPVIR